MKKFMLAVLVLILLCGNLWAESDNEGVKDNDSAVNIQPVKQYHYIKYDGDNKVNLITLEKDIPSAVLLDNVFKVKIDGIHYDISKNELWAVYGGSGYKTLLNPDTIEYDLAIFLIKSIVQNKEKVR